MQCAQLKQQPPCARHRDQSQSTRLVGNEGVASSTQALRELLRQHGPGHPRLVTEVEDLTRQLTASAIACCDITGDGVPARIEQLLQDVLALCAEVAACAPHGSMDPSLRLALDTLGKFLLAQRRPEVAFFCLQEARALSDNLPLQNAANSELALCTVFAEMQRHEEAATRS